MAHERILGRKGKRITVDFKPANTASIDEKTEGFVCAGIFPIDKEEEVRENAQLFAQDKDKIIIKSHETPTRRKTKTGDGVMRESAIVWKNDRRKTEEETIPQLPNKILIFQKRQKEKV